MITTLIISNYIHIFYGYREHYVQIDYENEYGVDYIQLYLCIQ
jgi:hypothetical protein